MMRIAGLCSFHREQAVHFTHEPLRIIRGGREHTLAFSGELYRTSPAALLEGLAQQGTAYLQGTAGLFAFAWWDGDTLTLVRDRIGAKPLFYALESGQLFFGSQPKDLFALGFRPAMDDDTLREIFALGPAHTPGSGVFKGLQELLPGQLLRFGRGGLHKEFYWQLQSRPHTDSGDETIEKVTALVHSSIEEQCVCAQPICAFLSGGLDSSLIASICARQMQQQGRTLATFSFDFAGNDEYYQANAFQPGRDAPFAREMAAYLGTQHTELTCDNTALADMLEPAMLARDMPGMADVDASLLYFCSIVGQDYKAALSGECADEIFGGYPWFRSEQTFAQRKFPWSDMQARRSFLREDLLEALDLEGYAAAAYEASAAETPRCEDDTPQEARRREIAWLNLRWFMQTLLDAGVPYGYTMSHFGGQRVNI